MALLTSLAEKSFAGRSKASGGSHNQPQAPRNARADRRGQTTQGQTAHPQQQIHSMPQMQPQGFRDQRDSYSQPNMTMQQSSGEFLYPWQLQSMQNPMQSAPSIYNSGRFFQPTGQQSMSRHANLSQTMAQGSVEEGPQIQYIEHRPGPNPMVLQVAPQRQMFRQLEVDRQFPAPSDQGMLSIGAQGGISNQQSDRY